jgi:hypothetical protein
MRKGSGLVVAFTLYATAAILLLSHLSLLEGKAFLGIEGTDPSLTIWMFRFLPQAVAHWQNPFLLHQAWAPYGLNITQATTTPLLALAAWPLTALAGPVVSYNIVALLTPALAATACFAFVRCYARTWLTAFTAAWIFGFSDVVFAPLLGHLQTAFIAFLPLAFLAVEKRAAGNLSGKSYFIWLFLVLGGEFLVSLEGFVTEIIFLFPFTVVAQAARTGGIKRLLRFRPENLVPGLIAAYAAVVLAMAPFVYSFFLNYGNIPHVLQNGSKWVSDLLAFVVPTQLTWLGGNLELPITLHFTSDTSENLAYIGVPLALLTLLAGWRLRREKQAWPLLTLLLCGFVFTLGGHLDIMGRHSIMLPWALLGKLPFLTNALPSRLAVFFVLGVCGVLAFWIDRCLPRRGGTALAALTIGILCILPATFVHPEMWQTPMPAAQLFDSDAYRTMIRRGETLLFLPFGPAQGNEMFWQAETGGYFRMTNGYGNFTPAGLTAWPAEVMLEDGAPGPDFSRQLNLFARAARFTKVIVPESILAVWSASLRSAGWNPQMIGNLTVFSVSPQLWDATPVISSAQARYLGAAVQLAALQAVASCTLAKAAGPINLGAAAATNCLVTDVAPYSGDPHQNWDNAQGWLGSIGKSIGLGVVTDAVTADQIVNGIGGTANAVYFPYPRIYQPHGAPSEVGQLLLVFPRKAIAAKTMK